MSAKTIHIIRLISFFEAFLLKKLIGKNKKNLLLLAKVYIPKMMKQVISTTEAPAAIGAYNQAILANGMLYASGQIPIDPKTGKLCEADIVLQTKQVFQNIENILKAAGLNLPDIVKTTVFIADMSLFAEFNDVYKSYFTKENAPARSCVAVKGLPMGALIEIECIATKA